MFNPTKPFFYLLAYLVVLYIRPHDYVPWLQGVPLLPILLATSMALWLARQPKDLSSPQFRILPVQAVIMGISVALSGYVMGAVTVMTDFYPVVLLFFMLATSVDSVARIVDLFKVMSVIMLVIAIHSIDQAEQGIGWTGAPMINERVAYLGFLSDPNDLSMAFLMNLPMVIYLARHSGWFMRLFWSGTALSILYAIKLANSRGAVLSLGMMVFQYGVFRFGLVRSLLAGPVLLLPIILFGPSRMNEMSADEESAEGRIDAWYEGFRMLMHHPIFGVGKGQFTDHNYLTAHNSYVLALAELGLVGFFVWFTIIFLTGQMARRVQAAGPDLPTAIEATEAASSTPAQADSPARASATRYGALRAPATTARQATTQQQGSGDLENWRNVWECSRTLWYGYLGGLVAMYFLSRSYVTILYAHVALIMAMFQLARKYRPDIVPVTFSDRWGRLLMLSWSAAFGLWLVTMILLRI